MSRLSSGKLSKSENLHPGLPERLVWLRKKHYPGHGGKTRFAQDLGIRLTFYVRYEKNVAPGTRIVAKMMQATNVNPRWLLWGIGDPYLDKPADARSLAEAQNVIQGLFQENESLRAGGFGKAAGHYIPILARASAAGTERVAYSDHGDLGRDKLPPDLHEIEVVGDSMVPLALDGQFLLVTNDAPRTGDVAVVELRDCDELLFKRVQIEPPKVICVSVNPDPRFPVITTRLNQIRRMRKVWGVKF